MDGYSLKRKLFDIIRETSTSSFVSDESAYLYIYYAVCEFCNRVDYLRKEYIIDVIAGNNTYLLPHDYSKLYIYDNRDRYYLKYTENNSTTNIYLIDNSKMYKYDSQNSTPTQFTIIDQISLNSTISGTVSQNSSCNEYGESFLYGNMTNISHGDRIINFTDDSSGYCVSDGNSTGVKTALLNGTSNGWTVSDKYAIFPKRRYTIYLNNIPQNNATIDLHYIAKPNIVFSEIGKYEISDEYELGILYYAAFLYKYRDNQPAFGDMLYRHFDLMCRNYKIKERNKYERRKLKVSLKSSMEATPYDSI